jgi:biopolymer transport protein ExbD
MSVRLDHGEDSLADIHEINVTPFIDVMLVLLIIFMVAAPLATVDVAVNLPTAAAQAQPRPPRPQFLTVRPTSLSRSATSRSGATRSAAHSMRRPMGTATRASSCAPTRPSPMATSWR